MSDKWSLLQSSIQFIKQKLKSYDLFKNNTENRISHLENKYAVLANSSIKNQKENLNGFDSLLAQSHIFINSLKKVDTNSMANIKKLQEYFGQVIHQQQNNFLLIQQKMLGMFSQKQKIIRNMSLEVDNHSHSIKAMQEWIKVDHNKGNSFTIMEQNIKQRLDMIQKNNEMKLNIIDEKIRYFQNLQESASNTRKKYAEERQEINQEIKSLRKDIRKKIDDLQEKLKEQNKMKSQLTQNKFQELQAKIDKNTHIITETSTKTTLIHAQLENRLTKQIKSLKQLIKQLQQQNVTNYNQRQSRSQQKQTSHEYRQSRTQKRQNNNSKLQNKIQTKKYGKYEQQSDVAYETPISYDRNSRNQINSKSRNQEFFYKPSKKQSQMSDKKPLPPKRNLFSSQSPEIQEIPKERSGGIRGLLQKSKQKERQEINRRSDTLSRQKGINKGLPPVRQDPFAMKKKNQINKSKKQQSEQQQIVYQIDEQGYLMDEEGNYLIDQNGEMIRLSPQELQQYMNEDQNYQ